jgi:hypothetical protein
LQAFENRKLLPLSFPEEFKKPKTWFGTMGSATWVGHAVPAFWERERGCILHEILRNPETFFSSRSLDTGLYFLSLQTRAFGITPQRIQHSSYVNTSKLQQS